MLGRNFPKQVKWDATHNTGRKLGLCWKEKTFFVVKEKTDANRKQGCSFVNGKASTKAIHHKKTLSAILVCLGNKKKMTIKEERTRQRIVRPESEEMTQVVIYNYITEQYQCLRRNGMAIMSL